MSYLFCSLTLRSVHWVLSTFDRPVPDEETIQRIYGRPETAPELSADLPGDLFSGSETEEEKLRGEDGEASASESDSVSIAFNLI